jgi:hypothetical protein
MILLGATSPIFSDSTGRRINLLATFQGLGQVPFTASADDSELHSRAIYADALAGKFGAVAAYVSPVKTWPQYQAEAQAALNKTDMCAIRCLKSGIIYPAAWQTYTATLRGIVGSVSGVVGTLPVQPVYPAGT